MKDGDPAGDLRIMALVCYICSNKSYLSSTGSFVFLGG